MRPVPVAFHIGPLEVHTYGLGLAVTFWFAYWYFERRLHQRGYPTRWVAGMFVWVIVAAILGARVMHVLATLGYYEAHPSEVLAVWNGGLSSFGGLILAVPTGAVLARRRCPALRLGEAFDIVAPVLAAAWAMGRLLGPQLMVAGGGHPTHQWFGMYYAGQAGRRLPVPIFQGAEDAAIFCVLLLVERRLRHRREGPQRTGFPSGAVIGTGMVLWGIERVADERLWLAYPGHLGDVLVEVAGVALVVGGVAVLAVTRRRWTVWLAGDSSEGTSAAGTPGRADHVGAGAPWRDPPGTTPTGPTTTGTVAVPPLP